MRICGACVNPRMRTNLSTCGNVECWPQLARRTSPVGGVTLVGSHEELRGPSGYTPRGFEPRAGVEVRIFGFYDNK